MRRKRFTIDLLLIIQSAVIMIIAFETQKQLNDSRREHKQTRETLNQYKAKLKECDYAYTANVKILDSVTKELYNWQDASFRARENVKQLRRFVKNKGL